MNKREFSKMQKELIQRGLSGKIITIHPSAELRRHGVVATYMPIEQNALSMMMYFAREYIALEEKGTIKTFPQDVQEHLNQFQDATKYIAALEKNLWDE